MDNSKLYCNIYYSYSDKTVPEEVKNIVEKFYFILRNEAVDLLNPHYEEWNAGYDKEVLGEDDMEYNGYIQNKQREILAKFNKEHWYLSPFNLKLDSDEYADIIGVFRWHGKDVIMHQSIKPINEKEWKEYHRTHK